MIQIEFYFLHKSDYNHLKKNLTQEKVHLHIIINSVFSIEMLLNLKGL